ncbi:hypothetical protein MMSR116_23885 [Methylobacterium mesophilicum SR1.6/6]|uniref:Uncharacterized protein n=1 Tax=Methylobacterium mesophilicum SR1.6/6 TaxID=908290 RepID=A0A6B9FPV4_9HYPH|nr:hypothetical protein [Methylobacterium mesophilicum]QGY04610.1 hypothetical protein MMSR116_23885 [Methylobacterium mesophilicum SR1.6/6]
MDKVGEGLEQAGFRISVMGKKKVERSSLPRRSRIVSDLIVAAAEAGDIVTGPVAHRPAAEGIVRP